MTRRASGRAARRRLTFVGGSASRANSPGSSIRGRSPLLEVEGPPNVPAAPSVSAPIVDEFRSLLRGELDGNARPDLATDRRRQDARRRRGADRGTPARRARRGRSSGSPRVTSSASRPSRPGASSGAAVGPPRSDCDQPPLGHKRSGAGRRRPPKSSSQRFRSCSAGCFDDPEYEWLADAGCVVIDEAHHSTAALYSDLLGGWVSDGARSRGRWSGLRRRRSGASARRRRKRLVARYGAPTARRDGFRRPRPVPDPAEGGHPRRTSSTALLGAEIELDAKTNSRTSKQTRLSPAQRRRASSDLKRRPKPTALDEVMRLPDDWTILLFATSVDHAQTMAALLTLEGITAKPITGLTDAGAAAALHRGVPRAAAPRADELRRSDPGLRRAGGSGRHRRASDVQPEPLPADDRARSPRPENGGKDDVPDRQCRGQRRLHSATSLAFRDFEYLWERKPMERRVIR